MRTYLLLTMMFMLVTFQPALGAEAVRFSHSQTIYADEKGGSLHRPEGAASREGVVIVADTGNGRLLHFQHSKGELTGGREIRDPLLPYPIRVQIDSKGHILALDGKLRHLVRFAPDGKSPTVVQLKGLTAGGTMLRSFAVHGIDHIYLLEVFAGRVILADASGAVQAEIPTPSTTGFYSDLTVDQVGTIYLLDSVNATIHSARKGAQEFTIFAKNLREYMNFPTSLVADNRGLLHIVDRNGAGIVLLAADGTFRGRQLAMGWKPGLLYYPSQLALHGAEAVIADRDNNRVQVFKLTR